MIVSKPLNLAQLAAELAAANVPVNDLGLDGNKLYTYDNDRIPIELPPAAGPIITAHVPDDAPKVKLMKADLGFVRNNLTPQIQRLNSVANPTPDQTALLAGLRGVRALLINVLLDS
jgi:hypothetical protein